MGEQAYHALGLHMHQPPGNMLSLLEANPHEAAQIAKCYERPARYAEAFKDVARFHVGFSGVLLDQLTDPQVVRAYRDIVDLPAALDRYRDLENVEVVGMGYYHPIFPLIPPEDWLAQLALGRRKIQEVFGRAPRGFWPPEMAFCESMIPAIREAGYEYVLVDHIHIEPAEPDADGRLAASLAFQPVLAEYEGAQIIVIPRHRDLSNAQESGMDPGWFADQVRQKLSDVSLPGPGLITTWSDGENGGWFRNLDEASAFWGHFFAPAMQAVREGRSQVVPTNLTEYLERHQPVQKARVRAGAWNIAGRDGTDFSQWAGSDAQRRALDAVWAASRSYHETMRRSDSASLPPQRKAAAVARLEQAYDLILQAQTSCHFYWGDEWVPRVYNVLAPARDLIGQAKQILQSA